MALRPKPDFAIHLTAGIIGEAGSEYRNANAAFYIERAERLREKTLAAKANQTPPRPSVPK